MPENYEKFLKDKAYLEFALKRYEEREKELAELINEPGSCKGANGRNSEQGETKKSLSIRLASSEGSPPLPYSWKGFAKRPFPSEAGVGGRGRLF